MAKVKRAKKKRNLFYSLLSVPLRFKITIPYLIIASLLAGLATYQVGSSFLSSLEARFKTQLADASARVADGVVGIEETHLEMARTIVFTLGVPNALENHDADELRKLVSPTVYNQRLWFVDVLDASGQPVLTLHRQTGALSYRQGETTNYTDWGIVRKVINGEVDQYGDKFIAIYESPWGKVLYTAAPVKTEEKIIGIVLVGTPLDAVAADLSQKSIADTTIYSPDGKAVASTLDVNRMASLSENFLSGIFQVDDLLTREATVGNREYLEVFTPLILRGKTTKWILGTILPKTLVSEPGDTATYQLIAIFVAGFLALIGLGIVIAHLISTPIFKLVDASQKVANGDLDVQVDVTAHDEIGILTQRFNRMVAALKQREFISEMFGRMVSKDVREAVLQNKVPLVGETKEVAVLFTDVRGFTAISERVSPKDVIRLLNDFFGIVTHATAKHEGIINHFGGDSVLAVFGAPISKALDVSLQQAILAACDMQKGVLLLNAQRIEAGLSPLRFGLGINSGTVVAGNIGSEDRFEYTVIGDVVNVAARLQGISRQFPQSPLLVPSSAVDSVRDEIPVDFDYLGEFRLKGKKQLVPAYAILGLNKGIPDGFVLFDERDYSRSIIFNAYYLACMGYPNEVIAQVLLVEKPVIDHWMENVANYATIVRNVMAESYGVPAGKMDWLSAKHEKALAKEGNNE